MRRIVLAERHDHLLRREKKERKKKAENECCGAKSQQFVCFKSYFLACAMPGDRRGRDQTWDGLEGVVWG